MNLCAFMLCSVVQHAEPPRIIMPDIRHPETDAWLIPTLAREWKR